MDRVAVTLSLVTKMSLCRTSSMEAVGAWRDAHCPDMLYTGPINAQGYCIDIGPTEPEPKEGPLAAAIGNSLTSILAHVSERRRALHSDSVVRPKRVAPLGPLEDALGMAPLALTLVLGIGSGTSMVALVTSVLIVIRVATPIPHPRAFAVLDLHCTSDLGIVMEIRAPAAAASQVMTMTGPPMDIGAAAMATSEAAAGTYLGAGIPPGSTCLTSGPEEGSTAYWRRGARSVAERTNRRLLVPIERLALLAPWAAALSLRRKPTRCRMLARRQLGLGRMQFRSRLGWSASLAATTTPRASQFVGSIRCLGRDLLPKRPLGRDSVRG